MPLTLELSDQKEKYCYADYLEWGEDVRAEIITGAAYMMAPPLTIHQRISMKLSQRIAQFLEGKTCEVFAAPFGVRLFPKEDNTDTTVVEPDLVVICDPDKIDERGCNGVPDLIIEILSPSNYRKERLIKFDLYLNAKVKEYWIVSPENKEITVHILENDRYFTRAYGINDPDSEEAVQVPEIVPVSVLPGLKINCRDIF